MANGFWISARGIGIDFAEKPGIERGDIRFLMDECFG